MGSVARTTDQEPVETSDQFGTSDSAGIALDRCEQVGKYGHETGQDHTEPYFRTSGWRHMDSFSSLIFWFCFELFGTCVSPGDSSRAPQDGCACRRRPRVQARCSTRRHHERGRLGEVLEKGLPTSLREPLGWRRHVRLNEGRVKPVCRSTFWDSVGQFFGLIHQCILTRSSVSAVELHVLRPTAEGLEP